MKFNKNDYGFITDVKMVDENGIAFLSYNRWVGLIHRCYNKNRSDYKYYGEKGVTICEEWHYYSNFKKWFDENYIDGYEVDKDIKGGNIYSPENCIFVSKCDNVIERNSRQDYNMIFDKYKGKNSKLYGKKIKEETKNKISKSLKGKFCGDKNPMFGIKGMDNPNSKDKDYYSANSTFRYHFKQTCKSKGWKFEDFQEVFAEFYTKPNGNKEKKYFYIFKE